MSSALLLLLLVVRSVNWPLFYDAPLMHYVAWLITQGGVPYRDAFEMNMPGVYLVHLAIVSWLGLSDAAWRAFDLLWLAATLFALYRYVLPSSDRLRAVAAALFFGLWHLGNGAEHAGQRDFLLCICLIVGLHGVARFLEGRGSNSLIWAGFVLGAAVTIKPFAALLWLLCLGAVAVGCWRTRAGFGPVARLAIAGSVPILLVLLWLAAAGGLEAFIAIVMQYLVPFYSGVGRVSGWALWGPVLLHLLTFTVLAGVLVVRRPIGIRPALAIAGGAFGVLNYLLQGKGWISHQYPLVLLLGALFAFTLPTVPATRCTVPRRLAVWVRAAPTALFCLLVGLYAFIGVLRGSVPFPQARVERVAEITDFLRERLAPDQTVQVLDSTEGGVHVLLRLGVRQPTRFLYDYQFYYREEDPRVQALRDEFVAQLQSNPPGAIVVFEFVEHWRTATYDRLEEIPPLAHLLQDEYELGREGQGYRIYLRRSS